MRLIAHGHNELDKEPPKPFWKLLLEQFSDLLVIMLIVASFVSMALGEYPAAITIIVIILANAVLGVVQESRAGQALDALESMSAPMAEVVRDGRRVMVDSCDLVPGDIVVLQLGKKIPADIRLVETQGLLSAEMALTGEPEGAKKDAAWLFSDVSGDDDNDDGASSDVIPAPKQGAEEEEEALTEKNMVYMGCTVQDGHGRGVVVKTGMGTKMGEIAHLLNTADPGMSPLQLKLHNLGVKLGLASIAISLVVFIIGVSTERGADPNSDQPVWLQMLLVAVSLTVASVPEGLPACVTITLAVGMAKMVEKHALIRNLHSVETLGSASTICTDKTGTLTKGAMTAVRLWFSGHTYQLTGGGYNPHGFIVPEAIDATNSQQVEAAARELGKSPNHTFPLLVALLCSNAEIQYNEEDQKWDAVGNSTERPLVVAARKAGMEKKEANERFPKLAENPFQSQRKMMSVLVDASDAKSDFPYVAGAKFFSCVKGAPNFILNNCTHLIDGESVREMTKEDQRALLGQVDAFSSKAYRVLAVAYRLLDSADDTSPECLESELILAGFVASIDPEREEVGPAVEKAYGAGIRVVMITGDYVKTAKAIAENVNILPRGSPAEKAIDCGIIRSLGEQIEEAEKELQAATDEGDTKNARRWRAEIENLHEQVDEITAYTDVYARAKPVDKITIVRSLQRQGNVCSMTGDGVNDSPALKAADIGVAMGITGTDVAKGAADMILTDDNFVSIVEAVEQGRTVYANITKFVFYLLSTNVSEVLTILIAVIMGMQSPLLPIQILWMNLATDGAPAVALAVEPTEPGIMDEGPRPKKEQILEKVMITGIVIQTFVLTTLSLVTYIVGLQWNTGSWNGDSEGLSGSELDDVEDGIKKARTMVILQISFCELLRAYTSRSLRVSVFTQGVFSNPWMQWAVGTSIAATVFIANVPGLMEVFELRYLNGKEWAYILCVSFIPVTVDELTKYVYRRLEFGRRPKVVQEGDLGKCRQASAFSLPGMKKSKSKHGGKKYNKFQEDDEEDESSDKYRDPYAEDDMNADADADADDGKQDEGEDSDGDEGDEAAGTEMVIVE